MKGRIIASGIIALGLSLAACGSLPLVEPTPEPTSLPTSDYQLGDISVTLPPVWTPTATIRPTITSTPTISPTASPTALPTWQPCEGAPPSQLRIGSEIEAAPVLQLPKDVYDRPGQEIGVVIGSMNPGEDLEILDGPICVDQLVWWEVESLERDLDGWMPEGDTEAYWLLPSQ